MQKERDYLHFIKDVSRVNPVQLAQQYDHKKLRSFKKILKKEISKDDEELPEYIRKALHILEDVELYTVD